jgi:hypothetical protein
MTTWKLTLASTLIAATAFAQEPPTPTPTPTPTPEPTPTPTPTPTTTPMPTPTPTTVPLDDTPGAAMTRPIDDARPEDFSVGIGFGYALPNSLETPNVTSARFRLASGLTFEPVVRFQQSSVEVDVGASTKNKETTVEIGSLVRYPLKSRRRVDFVLLGGAFVENIETSPDAMDMDKSTTTLEARYGLAVELWVTQHWQISMSALNTIFSLRKVSEQMGIGTETVTTTQTFGAIYDPVISAMVHLYY